MLSWALLQSLMGAALLLRYRKCRRERFHCAVICYHSGAFGGVSLGPFVFVKEGQGAEAAAAMKRHEYGHCIQSLLLGPFYLLLIALPSLVWCNASSCKRLRQRRGIAYGAFYTEKWADRLARNWLRDKTQ